MAGNGAEEMGGARETRREGQVKRQREGREKIGREKKSITERRVPELIPVLGSQPAGDVSHKPGGRLPLLSATPAAALKRAATNFPAW